MPARYMLGLWHCVRLYVCMFVTSRCSIKTALRITTQPTPSSFSGTPVLLWQTNWWHSGKVGPNSAVKYTCGRKNYRLSTKKSLYCMSNMVEDTYSFCDWGSCICSLLNDDLADDLKWPPTGWFRVVRPNHPKSPLFVFASSFTSLQGLKL